MNTPTISKPKAYSYLRFSTPEQQKGDSFRRQTSMAEAYAAENGLDLDNSLTFQDLGVSGFRGKNIKAGKFAEFLDAVYEGLIPRGSILLIEALDRLTRLDAWDAVEVLRSVINGGITVVTLNDRKTYNTESIRANPFDLMLAIMLFIRGNEESATKARRLKAAWEGKREKASEKPLTSLGPAWLSFSKETKKFMVIKDRATLVRRMFEMTLDGIGFERIAHVFNTEGHLPFGRAKQWHRTYVKKTLENPAVIGSLVPHVVEYEDGRYSRKPLEPLPNYYPAVVDEETFLAVQAMRQAHSTPKVKGKAPVNNLLGGLAKCPHCGATMTRVSKGATKKAVRPYLVCTKAKAGAGCTYHAVRQENVENALASNIEYIINSCPSGEDDIEAKIEQVTNEAEALDTMISNILEAIANSPSITLSHRLRELEDMQEEVKKRLEDLKKQQATNSSPLIAMRLEKLYRAFADTPIDRPKTNATLRQVFDSVTIDWPNGCLEFAWKQGGETSIMYTWPDEKR